jgi:hypothetical protein
MFNTHQTVIEGHVPTAVDRPLDWLLSPIDEDFINGELQVAAELDQACGEEPSPEEMADFLAETAYVAEISHSLTGITEEA